ncbi:MAG: hypothetical protein Q8O88_03115 [bacterium]|nr:hypothetical protein [bacterium]
MFEGKKKVKITISDLHLGKGADSIHEDFKHHPMGVDMDDTSQDYVLDQHPREFFEEITKNTSHCDEVILRFNGDTVDFSTMRIPGEKIPRPYEENAVKKLKDVFDAHREFWSALANFLHTADNTKVEFFYGNHDLQFYWPKIQEMLIQRLSPDCPEKVSFSFEKLEHGTYTRHGESEPHTKTNYKEPIIPASKISKLLNEKDAHDTLDVSLGHYLSSLLMYEIKKNNYLTGRMLSHGFEYRNGFKHIFSRDWFRKRFFLFKTLWNVFIIFIYTIRPRFWHMKEKIGLIKILRVIYWTFSGVFTGNTPKDSAMKLLHDRDDVDCVIYSHEHAPTVLIKTINGRTVTYMNTGTWVPLYREKNAKRPAPWKRFCWLQKIFFSISSFFSKHELEEVWICSGVIETIDYDGNIERQLVEWDRVEKTIKQLH